MLKYGNTFQKLLIICLVLVLLCQSISAATVSVVSDASPYRYGDTRLFNDMDQITKQYQEIPDAVVFVGDMENIVDSLSIYGKTSAKHIPTFYTIGNHDINHEKDMLFYRNAFNNYSFNPNLGYATAPTTSYSVNIGNIHFIILNIYSDNTLNHNCDWFAPVGGLDDDDSCYKYSYSRGIVTSTAISWIRNDLSVLNRTEFPFVVIFTHEPLYSQLATLMKEYDVTAYINGHTHVSNLYKKEGIILANSGGIGDVIHESGSPATILYVSSNDTSFKIIRVTNKYNDTNWADSYSHYISKELAKPSSLVSTNIIKNPSFDLGKTYWTFYNNGAGSFNIINGTAKIQINSVGTNMQLYQYGISLKAGSEYQLNFSGYSNREHNITVKLIQHASPYTTSIKYPVLIGTENKNHIKTFKVPTSTLNARLVFWLSGTAKPGDINYFDNVSLNEVS